MTTRPKPGGIWCVLIGLLSLLVGGVKAETNTPPTVEAQLAVISAQGYPTTMAELDHWCCPAVPGENAASVNREAFAQMVRPSKEVARTLPVDGWANWPAVGVPLPDGMRATIHDYLATNSAALALFNRAALLPSAGSPPEISESLVRATMLPPGASAL